MPIRKLAARIEHDLSYLCWQARIYGLSREEVDHRFQKLVGSYRQVVAAESAHELEQLLAREATRLDRLAS